MERLIRIVLAAVLMAACGTPAPGNGGQSDASVTPSDDRVTPGTDAGQPDSPTPQPDAAVPQDAPTVSDTPSTPPADVMDAGTAEDASIPPDAPSGDVEEMMIAGIGRMIMSGPFLCPTVACGTVNVSFYEPGLENERRHVDCNPARTRAGLVALDFPGDGWSDCAGNTCFRMDGAVMRAIIWPVTGGGCDACGTLIDIDMASMSIMPRSSGIRQACHE